MSPILSVLLAVLTLPAWAEAQTDFDRVLAKFNESSAAIAYEELPAKAEAQTLTCVYLNKKNPDKTLLGLNLYRIEKRLPGNDPVLGPKVLTFLADPYLQDYFSKNDEETYKRVKNTITANSIDSSLDHKYTQKPVAGKTNQIQDTLKLEVRKHVDGYFTLKSQRTHKFNGWVQESVWDGCYVIRDGACEGRWDYEWRKKSENTESNLVGYCWRP